ncbi:MAG: hypothetical protein IID08_01410 [Candidatus Hydrogenedentes bacterium]|nr:hypothetical protein [Candidatus Hydrogenedentota bacterium]
MKTKIVNTILALCCVVTHAVHAVAARAEVSEPSSLRGLKGVLVVIEDLHPDARTIELTRQSIQDAVEDRLRDAGIRIFTVPERLADTRKPYLYVNCNVIAVPDIELTVFSIDVESHQLVTLQNGDEAVALTWAKSYLGAQGNERAAQKIQDTVGELVDRFVSDFLAVNLSPLPNNG